MSSLVAKHLHFLGPPVFMPGPGGGGLPDKKELDGGQGGPPAKRLKTEENLMPEGMFLARNPPLVTFKVRTSPHIVSHTLNEAA